MSLSLLLVLGAIAKKKEEEEEALAAEEPGAQEEQQAGHSGRAYERQLQERMAQDADAAKTKRPDIRCAREAIQTK